MKKNKGITLIALIITIIITMIMIGVVVSIVVNSNILGRAKQAGDDMQTAYLHDQNYGDGFQVNIDGTIYNILEYQNGAIEVDSVPTSSQYIAISYNEGEEGCGEIYVLKSNTGELYQQYCYGTFLFTEDDATLLGTNVKTIMDNFYLTNDNKLYKYYEDQPISDNVIMIAGANGYGGCYYLKSDNTLIYYDWDDNKLIGTIEETIKTLGDRYYITNNNSLYTWYFKEVEVEEDEYTSVPTIVKVADNVNEASSNYYITNSNQMYVWKINWGTEEINKTLMLNNVTSLAIYGDRYSSDSRHLDKLEESGYLIVNNNKLYEYTCEYNYESDSDEYNFSQPINENVKIFKSGYKAYFLTNNNELYCYNVDRDTWEFINNNVKDYKGNDCYLTNDNKLYYIDVNYDNNSSEYELYELYSVLINSNVKEYDFYDGGPSWAYITNDNKLYYWDYDTKANVLITDSFKEAVGMYYVSNDNKLYYWDWGGDHIYTAIVEGANNVETVLDTYNLYYVTIDGKLYNNSGLVCNNFTVLNSNHICGYSTNAKICVFDFAINQNCFVQGTKVLTAQGLVNIEKIKSGDKVYTKNETTGEIEEDEVDYVHITTTKQNIYKVYTNLTYVEVTGNHPFYVKGKGWTRVENIHVGDVLVNNSNKEIEVTKIEIEKVTQPITVYNLKMKHNHNYFAGIDSILVHNKCFKAGTQVQIDMAGGRKAIEEIKVGDKVVTYNKESGKNEERKVTEVYVHEKVEVITKVKFSDGSEVEMTMYHPLYTKEGWKSLTRYNGYEELKIGDEVKTEDGWKAVKGIEVIMEKEPVDTYTIGVEGSDGYYVNGTYAEGL